MFYIFAKSGNPYPVALFCFPNQIFIILDELPLQRTWRKSYLSNQKQTTPSESELVGEERGQDELRYCRSQGPNDLTAKIWL